MSWQLVAFVARQLCRRPLYIGGALVSLVVLQFLFHARSGRVQTEYNIHPEIEPLQVKRPKVIVRQAPALDENGKWLTVNGKKTRLISGAVHYWRMPREYWEDRLLKLKAVGANTLETYVPWNSHEPRPNKFTFAGNLDLAAYLSLAKRLNLHVLLRPGPYICSEWDWGGLPAWLLADPNMQVRVNYPGYQHAAERYLKRVFEEVHDHFSIYGGPIIGLQLENEYGMYTHQGLGEGSKHLAWLRDVYRKHGVEEKLFTSDGAWTKKQGVLEREWATVNFGSVKPAMLPFHKLESFQPNRPIMVMEYWTGWFDHWTQEHHHRTAEDFGINLQRILNFSDATSVNMYMFYGGTNFGFMNGANSENEDTNPPYEYLSDTTSYDYDAPLSELGHLTDKFYEARRIIAKELGVAEPELGGLKNSSTVAYADPVLVGYVSIWDMLRVVEPRHVVDLHEPVAMELLPIHDGTGQTHGYTMYTTTIDLDQDLPRISIEGFKGNFRDRAQVFISKSSVAHLDANAGRDSLSGKIRSKHLQLQILVENAGRVNFGKFLPEQRKGLFKSLTTRGEPIYDWKVYPLEFDAGFLNRLRFGKASTDSQVDPGMWKYEFFVDSEPEDTFIDMTDFFKGIVFVNGINLGRYWRRGPTLSLYLPAPYIKKGEKNEIWIFEEMELNISGRRLRFSDKMVITHRTDVDDAAIDAQQKDFVVV